MPDSTNWINVPIESFFVVGIEGRTSNARELSGEGVIGRFWSRLFQEQLLNQIPNRVNDEIVAVYSDYESDKDGEYTYLLGARVHMPTKAPDGMGSRAIASGSYGMFTAQGGPPADMVIGIWKEIWSLENSKKLKRAYETDFEVYGENAVNVYLGVKLES